MTNYLQWSAAFASYFALLGVWIAFGPATLMASAPQIAPVALTAMTLTYFVATPFARKVWLVFGFSKALLLLSGGLSLSLLLGAMVPHWFAWCVAVAFFFGSGAYTVSETRLIDDLAQSGNGHAFGRSRKWGSFGYLAAAAVGGAVLTNTGTGQGLAFSLAAGGMVFWVCCYALARAVRTEATAISSAAATPTATHDAVAAATPAEPLQARAPLGHKVTGCVAVGSMRLAEVVSTTWFGAYWLETGHSALETGLLCALPVAAEFLAMWKGGKWVARFSVQAVMLMCCVASVVRWATTPFCSELWCAVPLQSLHAFTFGFFYPASLLWLRLSFGGSFFRVRYLTEAATRGVNAVVTFAAAGWVIATYGYGVLFGLSCALAAFSGGWWWLRMRNSAT